MRRMLPLPQFVPALRVWGEPGLRDVRVKSVHVSRGVAAFAVVVLLGARSGARVKRTLHVRAQRSSCWGTLRVLCFAILFLLRVAALLRGMQCVELTICCSVA